MCSCANGWTGRDCEQGNLRKGPLSMGGQKADVSYRVLSGFTINRESLVFVWCVVVTRAIVIVGLELKWIIVGVLNL